MHRPVLIDMRIAGLLLILIVIGAAAIFFANSPVRVSVQATVPVDFPDQGFSHEIFERLLAHFVDARGRVDYAAWRADAEARAELDAYLAAVSAYSPESTPERFATHQDALAYWLYAYNAWVVRTVLEHWPIGSVTDLKAPIEAVTGLGFFYRLRFQFGGESLSLYTVENERIRKQFSDPRIHFVLNCGSESCPAIRPDLPSGRELEALLDRAARDFVNDRRNVEVDSSAERIYLSAIFKWYRRDFTNWQRTHGIGEGLVDYLRVYADDALRAELADADEYAIEFRDFDWALNGQ